MAGKKVTFRLRCLLVCSHPVWGAVRKTDREARVDRGPDGDVFDVHNARSPLFHTAAETGGWRVNKVFSGPQPPPGAGFCTV